MGMTKTQDTTKAAQRFAEQHPAYSGLCILPGGLVETTSQAELDGFTIRPVAATVRPAQPIV
jgi:hypothetical protein